MPCVCRVPAPTSSQRHQPHFLTAPAGWLGEVCHAGRRNVLHQVRCCHSPLSLTIRSHNELSTHWCHPLEREPGPHVSDRAATADAPQICRLAGRMCATRPAPCTWSLLAPIHSDARHTLQPHEPRRDIRAPRPLSAHLQLRHRRRPCQNHDAPLVPPRIHAPSLYAFSATFCGTRRRARRCGT